MSMGIGMGRTEERVTDSCLGDSSDAGRPRILIPAVNMCSVDGEPTNSERWQSKTEPHGAKQYR